MTNTADIQPGTVLRSKYRVVRLIGRGGMGLVLEGHHDDLDRRVAIKVLHPHLRTDTGLVERFLREGRAASKIQSEHVARVLDVDRMDDGTPFLVMEYLDGRDLSFVRVSKTPLPIRDAVDYVVQACAAISEAHGRGIVHRDLKPANIFLARLDDGTTKIKVLDFGISKLAGPGGSEQPMTQTSVVMGSAEYMSPEQMLSTRDVDARSDIWALGIVLFEILTARVPFPGESLTQVCAMVMSQQPIRPRTLRPELPQPLEDIILRCLARDRADRYPSVKDLVRDLDAFLGMAPSEAPPGLPRTPTRTQRISTLSSGSVSESDPSIATGGGTSILPETPAHPLRPSGPPQPWTPGPNAPADSITGPPDPLTASAPAAHPPANSNGWNQSPRAPSLPGDPPSEMTVEFQSARVIRQRRASRDKPGKRRMGPLLCRAPSRSRTGQQSGLESVSSSSP